MTYALRIGIRYLRSKKRATISVITVIAVTGVALGVAALLAVMSITSGFQQEFRDKVLGVNAHVLVLKYGLDFEEYRDVVTRAQKMPEVRGAAPFIINEMMLAKGDRLSGVLVKGVDPKKMPRVLDLPEQMVAGELEGLRVAGAAPAPPAQQAAPEGDDPLDLDRFLADLQRPEDAGVAPAADAAMPVAEPAKPQKPTPVPPEKDLPEVSVPSPEDVEAALQEVELAALPSDELEAQRFEEDEAERPETPLDALPGIVLGATLAENLGIEVEDRVKVISPLTGLDISLWEAGGGSPRSKDFRVVGIFEAGFQEYDSRLVYVDLYQAQDFYEHGDTVTGVELSVHDIEKASDVSMRLERMLGGGPFHTMDWKELNHNLFTALEIQKVMLSLVIATIIFVAAFNVVATLIMIVLEKRREISILKAMGAKDGAILGIFMTQGAVIGLIGTAIGLVVGGAACAYLSAFEFPLDPKVYLIDHLPVRTSVTEFVLTVLISLAICVLATLAPSWWAARMLPADGIRYR